MWSPVRAPSSLCVHPLAGSLLTTALRIKGGLMQSSYHVQMVAMTGYLAAPGVLPDFRSLTHYFRW